MSKPTVAITFLSLFLSINTISSTLSPPRSPLFYHSLFLSASFADNSSIARHLHSITSRPHVAGTPANAAAARYVLSALKSAGVGSHITSYEVLLTYPVSRSLTLTRPPPEVAVNFSLKQEIYEGDPYADVAGEVLPTFHAYARSGTAVGPVVYANYGRVEDYTVLQSNGVNVTNNIVLARYGMIFRGDIVRNAYDAGAIGVVIFSDRKDYGGGSGAQWFPKDKWLPPSGVQVGSVFKGKGDPTTPGWASISDGCERLTEEEVDKTGNVPLIPSLPVSGADGETILRFLGGEVAKEDWQGSKDAPLYRLGPGPAVVNLNYSGENKITAIENVIGMIEGSEEPDRYIILGNHRDAWTFGAADPNSGTASLLEVAERLGKLQKKGWRPKRTIVLCNWDAEEYGLIGSTEWVEDNREILASRAVAYLNVDVAVCGPGFIAASTPQLDDLLKQVARQVQDPDNSSQTIYDSWVGTGTTPPIERLGGGGSDYAAFLQHVGVPSTDLTIGSAGYPVYHSMYDDYVWMEKFGDPMFSRHVAVASFWGSVALRLADDEFLPFNYSSYASELEKNTKELEAEISNRGINLVPLFKSIEELQKAATAIDTEKKAIQERKQSSYPRREYDVKVRDLNDRLMMAERAFTDQEGLSGRPWYKHLIYGPSSHNTYVSNAFPGVGDAIEKAKDVNTAKSWNFVQHEVWRVSRVIRMASQVLRGQLT